ncbi:hypothetical protein HS041_06230 [Planomonospora sp. ID67723]|uniref:hypothetical protein n=1 Tax=Planomonospora sp. ID67723 TaxID=2738134 RepID=UPI0018C3B93F|nr:hypothetical protein [Planomonospora sp. ID67723]MBG0827359.1 hypothetical protein [Planomonospora sp. ID67723]
MSNATPSPQPRKGLLNRLTEAADQRIWDEDDGFAERNGWKATRASLFVRRYRDPRFNRPAQDPDSGKEEIPILPSGEGGTPLTATGRTGRKGVLTGNRLTRTGSRRGKALLAGTAGGPRLAGGFHG